MTFYRPFTLYGTKYKTIRNEQFGGMGEKLSDKLDVKCGGREREKTNKMQQSDIYYQLVSTCFGHNYAHLQENKDRVLLHTVYCAGSAGCGW